MIRIRPTLSVVLALSLISGFAAAQFTPKRELRAAWISTVTNIDWPPSPGTPAATARASLIRILDGLASQGFNAVVFQIRPECDALYRSSLEPWSYYLTGSQGGDPGYDPLAFALEEAHRRGMELHAWFNPYRAVRSVGSYTVDSRHVSVVHPDWILVSGSLKMLNPGMAVVRDYVVSVFMDVVRHYDVDGVHMDDYFYTDAYPYTQDAATFAQEPRGFADQGDWRRDNVNILIKAINDSVHAAKPWVKFGMSPRGIWKNGVPRGIVGSDNYSAIWCDAVAWLQGQYIDYLAPQLYWKFGGGQDYGLLEPWWASQKNGRHLYPGLATYRIGQTAYGGAGEVAHQIRFPRDQQNAEGTIQFTANYLLSNTGGIADSLKRDLFRFPALLPRMDWKDTLAPNPARGPVYAMGPGGYALQWQAPLPQSNQDTAVRYAVYRFDHYPSQRSDYADTRNLAGIAGQRSFAPGIPATPGNYYYVVTSLDRNWNEGDTSFVVRVTPPPVVIRVSPAANASVPDSVMLVWRRTALASRYWLQMSTDSTFGGSLLINDSTLVDTLRSAGSLVGQSSYYWRVRAAGAGGWGDYASPARFTAGFLPPAALVSPANMQDGVQPVGLLRWANLAGAQSYRVQLSRSIDFASTILDSTIAGDSVAQYSGLSAYSIYFWRVRGVNQLGQGTWSATYRFRTMPFQGVEERQGMPDSYELDQNYPNPFNPTTTIRFALPAAGHVSLTIYDMLGREVARLVDAEMAAGYHAVSWNAGTMASGVYLYRLEAGSYVAVKRMALLK